MTPFTTGRWVYMQLSRRDLLRTSAAAGAVAATGASTGAASAAAPPAAAAPARKATLASTYVPGPAGAGGYRPVVVGPGEPHLRRTDLGVTPSPGSHGRRTALLAFSQLSDVHIVDAQSPLRVEFTDRLDDPAPTPATGLFTSAYRPQEMLTGQIADAMVRELNAIGGGPVTGKPLALALQTGDNSDNSQYNEVRWNIDVLGGGTVRVDSGSLLKYEGVADDNALYYDRAYWHPHGTPRGKYDDTFRSRYGFPTVPGLLDAARRPFEAAGLDTPWLTVNGNHDGLVQGNFPQNLQLGLISTGPLKLVQMPPGMSHAELLLSLQSGDLLGVIRSLSLTPAVRPVTPDPDRRLLTRKQFVEEHFRTSGTPEGHGFTTDNKDNGHAYYYFDQGLVRFVVMDTCNPNGYYNGSIDADQFAWLGSVLAGSTGRIVVVASHHNSWTMDNPFVATGGDLQPRVQGPAMVELLLSHPEVVAWVNGHSHKNEVVAHSRPGGGGFWEINTAAHIDWPQQSRIIEIADNRDGTLSIFTTIVDHAGSASYGGSLADTAHLASLGRELAMNDPQDRSDTKRGTEKDRNLELVVANPT